MKNKIPVLITCCVITVFALLAIQGYFIYNTYQLKEKQLLSDVKSRLSELEDDKEISLGSDRKEDVTQEFLVNYSNGTRHRKDLLAYMQSDKENISGVVSEYVKLKFKDTGYDIGIAKYFTSIIALENGKRDTISNEKIEVYNNHKKLNDVHVLSSGTWLTQGDHSITNAGKKNAEKHYAFEVKRMTCFSVNNLKELVFAEMTGLFAISLFLMLFVVLLFYFSLKNLIKQQRIAEIQRDFINNITHEFKTPLATLGIATKTLKRQDLDAEILENTTDIIERQNNRLQKIFNEVSFNSLLLSREDNVFEQKLNAEMIENAITDFKLLNPEIEIISKIDTVETIKISKFHFNTILTNLLENAVKYGGKKLTVSSSILNNSFVLIVEDDGIGIAKKEQTAIFDKFYRIQNGNIHNTKGLGLGLFYAREIIKNHNGKITVESQENKGSAFTITIPLQ